MTSKSLSASWFCLLAYTILTTPAVVVDALSQSLCSSQNTGSDSQAVSDDYQSNGRCFDTCKANYAFAVVQGKNCWCSNYAPADTASTGSCDSPCPGYPFEQCGSSGFFGYVPLNQAPLGTIGASHSQQSTSSSPAEVTTSISQLVSSPISPQTSSRSVDLPPRPSPSISSIAGPQLSSRTFLGLPTSSPPSSPTVSTPSFSQVLTLSMQTPPTPSPVTVKQTVTASPSVTISLISVTPTTTPEPTTETTTTSTPAKASTRFVPVPISQSTTSESPSSTSSTPLIPSTTSSAPARSTWTPTPITSVMTVTGQITTVTITPTAPPAAAGLSQSRDGGFMSHPGKVAGLFVGVGLIICLLAAALLWFFCRRKRDVEAETIASTVGEETPQRRQSKLSTMGLLGGTRRSNNRKSAPTIQTSGWGPGNSTEKSPTETPIEYRRTSYPRIVDQRLEPTALWNPLQDNGSHVSIQSFRDDQDYSRRMLRVANPDDRPVSRD